MEQNWPWFLLSAMVLLGIAIILLAYRAVHRDPSRFMREKMAAEKMMRGATGGAPEAATEAAQSSPLPT